MAVTIRAYRSTDLDACRALWRELTQRHREIYEDPTIGGEDPGVHFDEYLARSNLAGPWVAEHEGSVVGLCGLLLDQSQGEIEPIVVSPRFRSIGVGRQLLQHVEAESRRRGIRYLSIKPVARNVDAMACFHRAGFRVLGHIEMFRDLGPSTERAWKPGVTIHGNRFEY